ncbi:MAG: DUF3097 family protein, partial [Acidobacteria bacterium]|nr:DUF3097 family protein [Acidobacteriota bacterium]
MDGPRRRAYETVPATRGLEVEHQSGVRGRIEAFHGHQGVVLSTPKGREIRVVQIEGGFKVGGRWVTLGPPPVLPSSPAKTITASGSIAIDEQVTRVARASRIWVEGIHDAELVEKVWGDDLRAEGIVVEPMHGLEDLPGAVLNFGPGPARRLGVLVDHLVDGSKESRIAAEVRDPNVLVAGHRFIDVWEAVDPARLGLDAWPKIPYGQPWKESVAEQL